MEVLVCLICILEIIMKEFQPQHDQTRFNRVSCISEYSTGFIQVMENLESHGIFKICFPGLESHGILVWVMESHGK